ncbi:porin family protein [Algoriphagus pacificus]|uniref:PorT family protein n=1 Tax=Algoriphagus pacificus TaxID=2811234 RepID=A0ABS3CL34_9BACT|nr:porin family protein [Algoriphagus pacificus]MBN7817813.1 PorT family protein [Algoriphagus pacificus]
MRLFLICIFSIGLLSWANAQPGVRAGLSSGNLTDTNYNAILGIHGGLYYNLNLGFIGVEPGIQFAQKGYRGNDRNTGKVSHERLNYVDVPLLLRFNFLPEVNLFVGPQVSFLMSRKYELDGFVDTSTEAFTKNEFGGVGGIGVNFPYGVNFQVSFDIAKTDLGDNYVNKHNKVFKMSLGFDFF